MTRPDILTSDTKNYDRMGAIFVTMMDRWIKVIFYAVFRQEFIMAIDRGGLMGDLYSLFLLLSCKQAVGHREKKPTNYSRKNKALFLNVFPFISFLVLAVFISGCQSSPKKSEPKKTLKLESSEYCLPTDYKSKQTQKNILNAILLDNLYWFLPEPSISSKDDIPIPTSSRISYENLKEEMSRELKKNKGSFGHWLPDILFTIHQKPDWDNRRIIEVFLSKDQVPKKPDAYELYLYTLLMINEKYPEFREKETQRLKRILPVTSLKSLNYSPLRVMIRRMDKNGAYFTEDYLPEEIKQVDPINIAPEEYLQIADALPKGNFESRRQLIEKASSKRWPEAILRLAKIGEVQPCINGKLVYDKAVAYYSMLGVSLGSNSDWEDYRILKKEIERINKSRYASDISLCE